MIMRIGFSGITVYVSADAKAQVGIFINNLPIRCIVVDIRGNEFVVLERLLDEMADSLASRWAGIFFERSLDIGGKRIKRETHNQAPLSSRFYSVYKMT
jgi:hypothetical protein